VVENSQVKIDILDIFEGSTIEPTTLNWEELTNK